MTAIKSYFFEDLVLGQEASLSKSVGEADIVAFADLSGDRNPVHIDAAYAATTMFKERIAHGMLSAAYISAVFGMQLPGPGAIYVSQTLSFKAPVKIGDTVVTTVKVAELALANGVQFRRAPEAGLPVRKLPRSSLPPMPLPSSTMSAPENGVPDGSSSNGSQSSA